MQFNLSNSEKDCNFLIHSLSLHLIKYKYKLTVTRIYIYSLSNRTVDSYIKRIRII